MLSLSAIMHWEFFKSYGYSLDDIEGPIKVYSLIMQTQIKLDTTYALSLMPILIEILNYSYLNTKIGKVIAAYAHNALKLIRWTFISNHSPFLHWLDYTYYLYNHKNNNNNK